jgi:proline iminopeptidase
MHRPARLPPCLVPPFLFSLALFLVCGLAWPGLAYAVGPAPSPHPKGSHRQVFGKKIWVEIAGKGEPLLLIPGGGGGSHDYYHPYFDALAATRQVIYYDGFGRGSSDHAKEPREYSFARDVEEVEALRKALGLDRIDVYGHSYGGMVAQAYAVKYPQSVRRLILANTPITGRAWQESNEHINNEIRLFLPEIWKRVEKVRGQGKLSNSPEHQAAFLDVILKMFEMFYFYDPAKVKAIVFDEHTFNAEEYYQIAGPDADFQLGSEMLAFDHTAELGNLKMPVLVIAGRADGIVYPAVALRFKRYLTQAEMVIFEKSGHFPFIEETDKQVEVIKTFLSRP